MARFLLLFLPALATAAPTNTTTVHNPGQNGLTPEFLKKVNELFLPAYGTEQLAPLLHALIRFHRPERVAELGFGYTTPFLARALADNAINAADEGNNPMNSQRQASILHQGWYDDWLPYEPTLHVIDDQSQRQRDNSGSDSFAHKVRQVLQDLELDGMVDIHDALGHAEAHRLFEPDSLGLVWNDAQWDPEFLRTWWPLVQKDGGLLLLHNVIGQGEVSRWCVASPRRVMEELFPGERFEFLTLMEPHKAYQGSVAILRRLDPAQAPDKYLYLWGGVEVGGTGEGVRQVPHIMDALDRVPEALGKKRKGRRTKTPNTIQESGGGEL